MPRLDELGALAELANRQGWEFPTDLGDTPLAGLGRPEGVTLGGLGDPHERAAFRFRRQATPERPMSKTFDWLSRRVEGETPLDWAAQGAMFPMRTAARVGTLVGGALLTPSEAEGGPRKAITSAARAAYDAIVPGSKAWRDAPMPEAPMGQYATDYPAAGPPTPTLKEVPSYPGELYDKKTLTPEARLFERTRAKIAKSMQDKGFEPYFDPEKRKLVDQSKYPARQTDTADVIPAKQETAQQYWDAVSTPEVRARLDAAIRRGEELGGAENWYFMSQLEGEYIKELGAKAGRKAFLDEFAFPMAATTSGQQPGPNLLMAHYLEFLRKRGLSAPEKAHQLPTPVGGRYAQTNIDNYQTIRARGGYAALGEDQPKMLDFSRSMVGDLSRPVMDEQMVTGMLAGSPKEFINSARASAYGMMQRPVMEAAASRGVLPGNIQDVAWAGFKNEPGKAMIQIVNEAIERTHRLTGMARSEIVRLALVRKEIPLYVATALVGNEALRGALDGQPPAQPRGEGL